MREDEASSMNFDEALFGCVPGVSGRASHTLALAGRSLLLSLTAKPQFFQ